MFSEHELSKTINDYRFIECLKFMMDDVMVLCEDAYVGDLNILQMLKDSQEKRDIISCPGTIVCDYEILKDVPLPYLSPCLDELDKITRLNVLNKLKDKTNKNNIYWWSFVHQCVEVAIFIIYPICRLLFPEMDLYIYDGLRHTVVTNTIYIDIESSPLFTHKRGDDCIFDFISITLDESREWIFKHNSNIENSEEKFIVEQDIVNWYIQMYGYDGFNVSKMEQIFNVFKKR